VQILLRVQEDTERAVVAQAVQILLRVQEDTERAVVAQAA
jgi:diphthamide biosynthesis methyltransferase